MAETKYLKNLLDEIGHGVHNLNTIAVALSNLPQNSSVNPALNIKWEPKNIDASSFSARRFAVRSSVVLAAESLFEYMDSISNDPVWKSLQKNLDFRRELASHDSKAKRFSEFCKKIPEINREWFLLVELLCHWRNRIVHASTSKAQLSSSDAQYLVSKSSEIYEDFHHFDINKTLSDYEADKVTLKEATTLITLLIKCCRKIDKYYICSAASCQDDIFHEILSSDDAFKKLQKQQSSNKRSRQIGRHIRIKFPCLSNEKISGLIVKYK